jgi:hypothetical protein
VRWNIYPVRSGYSLTDNFHEERRTLKAPFIPWSKSESVMDGLSEIVDELTGLGDDWFIVVRAWDDPASLIGCDVMFVATAEHEPTGTEVDLMSFVCLDHIEDKSEAFTYLSHQIANMLVNEVMNGPGLEPELV